MGKLAKILVITIVLFSSFSIVSGKVEASKYNMSYLYFGQTDSFIEAVNKTNDSLDSVAPSYFDLNPDGTLDDKVDPAFVTAMHQQNIKVVPFLSNHWDQAKGRKALENRESLVIELVEAIEKYNLDGINIDLENMNELDTANYTEFVRLLSEALPEDKEISVAVAAKSYDATIGWHASYDFEELAKYSDYLMLMTYDESYYGSAPGPVASMDFVEKSIQYALTKVPSDKLVLGVPFYGRYWQIGSYGGRGISLYRVEELVAKYNGKVYFDEAKQSTYAVVTIPNGVNESVHGRALAPGEYVIWYESDKSIKLKLKLVEKYNLKGTGSWSLNEAPSEIWGYYQNWLNGNHYFLDAENHWAETDINSVYKKNWMIGTSDYTFMPNESLTRAQGAVVLVRALGVTNDLIEGGNAFADVSDNYWAKDEIEIAYQYGIVKGVKEGEFAPEEQLTREQMAAMLSRIFNYESGSISNYSNPFSDISSNHWAYKDILILNKFNVFTGYEDGKFRPKNSITRAEMAALMNRISDNIANIN